MEDIEYDIVDGKAVEGKSSSFYLFWFIPVTPELSLEEAIDDAIKNSNGHNLVNVTVYIEEQFLILGTVYILRVQGVAVKYK